MKSPKALYRKKYIYLLCNYNIYRFPDICCRLITERLPFLL